MTTTLQLQQRIIKAVEVSMRIEGYTMGQSEVFKQRARKLMEQKSVKVSIQSK